MSSVSVVSFSATSTEKMLSQAVRIFQDQYGKDPEIATFAPGRVNLIGEHTDYNDGFVLPMALPFRTIIVGSKSTLSSTRVYSCNITNPQECIVSFTIDDTLSKGPILWANYIKGTIYQYLKDLPAYFSFDAVVISNVPIGSGLSSSASLEVATATFVEKLCGLDYITGIQKALRCQRAEHTFADTPCGIMDQYISSMGKEGSLLLIDCRSTEYKLIALTSKQSNSGDTPVILITNSNVKHTLSGSEYPERVAQCREAVTIIQKKYYTVKALRDVTMQMLQEFESEMPPLVYQRASHSVGEDGRTLATIEAIKEGNYEKVGQLMNQSHISLRDKYEVSCRELDTLVDWALQVPGVYGSRMTGGGFGGCTVTLVKKSAVELLKAHLKKNYKDTMGLECECYEAVPSEGAGSLDLTPYITTKKDTHNLLFYTVPIAIGIIVVGIVAYLVTSSKSSSSSSSLKKISK